MNVNISNELNFSDVYRSVNYIGSLAKFTWAFTLHTPQYSLHFDKPQKNEIHSLNNAYFCKPKYHLCLWILFTNEIHLSWSREISIVWRLHIHYVKNFPLQSIDFYFVLFSRSEIDAIVQISVVFMRYFRCVHVNIDNYLEILFAVVLNRIDAIERKINTPIDQSKCCKLIFSIWSFLHCRDTFIFSRIIKLPEINDKYLPLGYNSWCFRAFNDVSLLLLLCHMFIVTILE